MPRAGDIQIAAACPFRGRSGSSPTAESTFINERREFFFATPAEVRAALLGEDGGLLEFRERPDAPEYFQSVGRWPDDLDHGPAG